MLSPTSAADDVVLATNYSGDQPELDAVLARSSVALHTYIVVTKPLGKLLNEVIEGGSMDCVCDDRFALGYFRPIEGMWSTNRTIQS
tara:strand:- start:316 stop:576 length:261 start_codon:yes stop_codon:yes gene_type:complete